jgi:Mn-containing catalase
VGIRYLHVLRSLVMGGTQGELRCNYKTLKQGFESVQTWSDELLGNIMANIAHTAYHLGAIRQVVRAVQ